MFLPSGIHNQSIFVLFFSVTVYTETDNSLHFLHLALTLELSQILYIFPSTLHLQNMEMKLMNKTW